MISSSLSALKMKLTLVFVLLLCCCIEVFSKACPKDCFCSKGYTICKRKDYRGDEVKFSVLSESHLHIECSSPDQQLIEQKSTIKPFLNITDVSVKRCNLKEISFEEHFPLDNNKSTMIKKVYIESSSDVIANQSEWKYFENLTNLEEATFVINSSSTDEFIFNFEILLETNITFINLTNIGKRRDLVMEGSLSDTDKKFSYLKISGFILKNFSRDNFEWLFKTDKLELSYNNMEINDEVFQQASENNNLTRVLPDVFLLFLYSVQNVSLEYNKPLSIPKDVSFNSHSILVPSIKLYKFVLDKWNHTEEFAIEIYLRQNDITIINLDTKTDFLSNLTFKMYKTNYTFSCEAHYKTVKFVHKNVRNTTIIHEDSPDIKIGKELTTAPKPISTTEKQELSTTNVLKKEVVATTNIITNFTKKKAPFITKCVTNDKPGLSSLAIACLCITSFNTLLLIIYISYKACRCMKK